MANLLLAPFQDNQGLNDAFIPNLFETGESASLARQTATADLNSLALQILDTERSRTQTAAISEKDRQQQQAIADAQAKASKQNSLLSAVTSLALPFVAQAASPLLASIGIGESVGASRRAETQSKIKIARAGAEAAGRQDRITERMKIKEGKGAGGTAATSVYFIGAPTSTSKPMGATPGINPNVR